MAFCCCCQNPLTGQAYGCCCCPIPVNSTFYPPNPAIGVPSQASGANPATTNTSPALNAPGIIGGLSTIGLTWFAAATKGVSGPVQTPASKAGIAQSVTNYFPLVFLGLIALAGLWLFNRE
jgi:hypothetical protein